jgi:hypothetical protein
MQNSKPNIIDINRIDRVSRCALIPGYSNKKKVRKIKDLTKSRGNCLFTSGISHSMIDFIYRAIVKLRLKDKKFIFSRGAVKINGISVINAISIKKLDWDVGISMRIPHRLKYDYKIQITVENEEHELRLMELIVLSSLLRMTYPGKKSEWYSVMSATIIAGGWPMLDKNI